MAATKAKNPAAAQPRESNPSTSRPLRTPKSRKGKAKEDVVSTSELKNVQALKGTVELTEDVPWPWSSLTDALASRQAPVFTKDGSYFFSVVGSTVKIYSAANGQVVSTLSACPSGSSASKSSGGDGHTDMITAAILSPNNPFQLITASLDGCIKIWDYLEAELLQTVDLAQPILHLCIHENFQDSVFVAVSRPGKKRKVDGSSKDDNNAAVLWVSLKASAATAGMTIQKSSEIIAVGKTRSPCGLALSPSGQWLVAVAGHKAYVAQTSSLKSGFTKFVSPEALTCLAFHPSEEYFATGDAKGNIRLWYCLNEEILRSQSAAGVEKKAQTTTLHWHAHAISSLTFSLNGAYLLSGGEESVLVIWQLHSGKKEFVPRVGSPILSIAVFRMRDHGEGYLLGLADASFAKIDAGSLKITQTFSRIKLDSSLTMGQRSLSISAPLTYHNQTASLILPSSHPSSLQAYSPSQQNILMELEVSPSNRVSRRDEKRIEPSRVLYVAISRNENWMATLDSRDGDNAFHREIYLKLWHWNSPAGFWSLNTRIDRPHGDKMVNTVAFSPDCSRPSLVTTGEDGKVRGWGVRSNMDKSGEREDFWAARSSFGYRSELPKHASWSPDGSLLAISFGACAVLCDPATNLINCVLTSSHCKSVSSAHFIGTEGRYLAVIGLRDIVMWDLITQTVHWHHRCSLEVRTVVPHPTGSEFAVFHNSPSTDDTTSVVVFNATSRTPVKTRSLPFRLLNVMLYPSPHPSSSFSDASFTLVGITTAWSVVMLGDKISIRDEQGDNAQTIAKTVATGSRRGLFQDIFGPSAFTENYNTQPILSGSDHAYPRGHKDATGILDGPAHLMPPIESMFDTLMAGYMKPRPSVSESKVDESQESDDAMDEELDVHMDPAESAEPVVVGRRSERIVSVQEMDMFVELFKQHAVSRHKVITSYRNGHTANGYQRHSNGHQPRPRAAEFPSKLNGRQQSHLVYTPSKAPTNGGLDLPGTPATAGKKRKKSIG